ncbi:MAG: hypothetical protein ACFCVF_06330 [Kineosporiaceae bacterium]
MRHARKLPLYSVIALLLAATSLIAPAAWATAGTPVLSAGQTLRAGQQLVAPDGSHRLVMQTDGNVVVYTRANRAVCSWGTRGSGNRLVMQGDGNLVVYSPGNRALWASRTSGTNVRFVMQSDGNAVVYSSTNRALWNCKAAVPVSRPAAGNVLASGATLPAGAQLVSPARSHRVVVQADGNVVLYGPGNAVRWASRTSGTGNRLVMQGDGNLVVYTTAGRAAWNSGTSGNPGARAVLQDDGNFVVYRPDGRAVWASAAPAAPSPRPGCDAAYPDVCIAPPPPDLDCGDIPHRRFRVLAPDPHNFDSDRDGVGCEN